MDIDTANTIKTTQALGYNPVDSGWLLPRRCSLIPVLRGLAVPPAFPMLLHTHRAWCHFQKICCCCCNSSGHYMWYCKLHVLGNKYTNYSTACDHQYQLHRTQPPGCQLVYLFMSIFQRVWKNRNGEEMTKMHSTYCCIQTWIDTLTLN